MGKVQLVDNSFEFIEQNSDVLDRAMGRMANDIALVGRSKVPFKLGDLFKNITAVVMGLLQHRVLADTEYAGFQEYGKRKDGSHVVEHYTTPSTGAHYLYNGAMQIVVQALNYLKQAVHEIKLPKP